ncbi:hypothetical protein TNCV_2552691 [Trichonephila clavipes]|nr:hypothetical protein TNCV_2552691 [Trichonephila clavipes]
MAVGSLVVRTSDSRTEGVGSIPDASDCTRKTCSLNQWVRKSCGLNHECRGLENISLPSSSMAKLWSWRYVVAPSIAPSGNFSVLKRTATCMELKA